jgi:hypothetical protein
MRSPLLVLLMLVALVGAGCGGDDGGGAGKTTSNEDYGKQLAQAGQTLQKTFSDIGDESGSSSTQIANRLDQAAKAIDDSVKDFQAITPPPAAKAAHAKIISGLQDIADVCRQGADAARKKDSAGLAKALKGLSAGSGLAKITEAQKELQAKGITVTTASGG